MHCRLFHHGPCRSHRASYLSQASPFTARKAQRQSRGGHRAPLPRLDGCRAAQCCPARAQPVPPFLLSAFSFQIRLCEVSQLGRSGRAKDRPWGLHRVVGRQEGHLCVGARADWRGWRLVSNCFSQDRCQEESRLFLIKPTTEKDP